MPDAAFPDAREPDPLHDLDDELMGPEPDWDSEPVPPPDAANAEKMLFRLSRVRSDRVRVKDAADLRIAQVEAWRSHRDGILAAQETYIIEALERYHRAVIAIAPKQLSINLPSGDLTSKMGQPEWTIEEAEVIEWAVPAEVTATFLAAREAYVAALGRAIAESDDPDRTRAVLDIKPPSPPGFSRKNFKAYATRRDEKDKPVAWGIDPQGEPIPGVTVKDPERQYGVKLTAEDDDGRDEITDRDDPTRLGLEPTPITEDDQ